MPTEQELDAAVRDFKRYVDTKDAFERAIPAQNPFPQDIQRRGVSVDAVSRPKQSSLVQPPLPQGFWPDSGGVLPTPSCCMYPASYDGVNLTTLYPEPDLPQSSLHYVYNWSDGSGGGSGDISLTYNGGYDFSCIDNGGSPIDFNGVNNPGNWQFTPVPPWMINGGGPDPVENVCLESGNLLLNGTWAVEDTFASSYTVDFGSGVTAIVNRTLGVIQAYWGGTTGNGSNLVLFQECPGYTAEITGASRVRWRVAALFNPTDAAILGISRYGMQSPGPAPSIPTVKSGLKDYAVGGDGSTPTGTYETYMGVAPVVS